MADAVPYVPRNWAIPFHQSYNRWAVKVLHRRAGKSTSSAVHHQRAATNDNWERGRLLYLAARGGFTLSAADLKDRMRARQYGIVLPTLTQAKMAAWDDLKYWAAFVKGAQPNESELRIDYPGGHRVQLFGADRPDRFRGGKFSGISFDEYGMQPPNIFSEVVSKNLADHLGYAIFEGTIKGKNQLYKTYHAAKDDPEWCAIWQDISGSLKSEEGAVITLLQQAMFDDQKLIAKGLMSQAEFDQEWYLSQDAAIKGSIYSTQLATARREKRIGRVPYDQELPVHDVWDLGAGANMAVGCFQRVSREIHLIEYLEGDDGDGLPQMIAKLQRRPYVWGKHFAPHDIKATDLSTGKTREETAKRLHWPFTIVPDIGVADGLNAARLAFARLWIDETHCAGWLDALPFYRKPWNEKLQTFGEEPVHDFASHKADLWRYAAVAEEQMTNDRVRPKPPTRPRPPTRDGLGWMGQ